MNTAPRTLSHNPAENAVLMTYDAEGGSYELHILPKDPGRGDTFSVSVPTSHTHHLQLRSAGFREYSAICFILQPNI